MIPYLLLNRLEHEQPWILKLPEGEPEFGSILRTAGMNHGQGPVNSGTLCAKAETILEPS